MGFQTKQYVQALLEKCTNKIREETLLMINDIQNYGEDKDTIIIDFSDHFKNPLHSGKKKKKKKSKKSKHGNKENVKKLSNDHVQEPKIEEDKQEDFQEAHDTFGLNHDLEDDEQPIITYEIPKNLTITQEQMKYRKHLDLRRWFCISRPQYSKSCGLSSVTSCWNFLYSTLGSGTLPPLSQEEALTLLGFQPPFSEIGFGPFTGNGTLIRWFNLLNKHFGLNGRARIFWKLHGTGRTMGIEPDTCLSKLQKGLRNDKKAFIYHCFNHYFCPIGYEITPMIPADAYKSMQDINRNEVENWILIGEPSKRYPPIHVKRWEDIVKDINCQNPHFYNIRNTDLGIQERKGHDFVKGKKLGGNLHCIIVFEKV